MINDPFNRQKRYSKFIKAFIGFALLLFIMNVDRYKSGYDHRYRMPTHSKPTPNSWQYVYENLPGIINFSIFFGFCIACFGCRFDND